MTTPRETLAFDTRHIGRTVRVYDSVTSTNDLARTAEPGTVIVADHQTAGRGQYARTWTARPGTSLLLSVVLDTPPQVRRPVILTAWAAVSVAKAIHTLTRQQVGVKWPNDLLVRGKKVCGILIEQQTTTVVGIGLNLNQSAANFAADQLLDATSLAVLAGHSIDPPAALGAVIRHLDEQYDRLLSGDRHSLEAAWKWRMGLLGRQVVAELFDGRTETGTLREMNFDGIELLADGGPGRVLKPETIRQLRAT